MKGAPDDQVAPDISVDAQRTQDFLEDLARDIRRDFEDRAQWAQAREHYFSRRYCMEWRNPTTPWVGASNIVIPIIDKKIDELKPQYVNMVMAAKPPVTVEAIQPQFQKKSKNVELLFDWLIHYGSPRFNEELVLAVDDCLEMGRGILKSYWHYETRQVPEVLTANRLPKELKRLIVSQDGDDGIENLFIARGGGAMPMGEGPVVITKKEFDRNREAMRLIIQQAFDFDPEEKRDQKAIEQVLGWLRSGAKQPLTIESRDVIRNVPAARAISPIDLVVPQNATDNVEEHERICEVMYLTRQQLEAAAIDQDFDKGALAHLLDKRKKAAGKDSDGATGRSNWQKNLIDIQQANREGITSTDKHELFELWRVYSRFSMAKGGPEKKVAALIPADAPEAPLKMKAWSRPSGRWGIHTFTFEQNKRRWYAPRGVPEKADDLEAEITAQHRAKLNRASIVNSPTFKYKPNRHINPAVWKWYPGQMMPTQDPVGDVIPVEHQNMDVSFDNEVQILQVYLESYLGGPDYGLTGNSTLTEPRTATEIQAIQGQARQSLSMRGLLFKSALNEMWDEWLGLYLTLGSDVQYINVTGGDEPIRLTKEQIQGQYILNCTGTIGSSDPVLEAQKAQNAIILLAQMKPLVEPQFEINLGEAVQDWMEKYDIRLMKRVLRERSPEEIQQIMQQQREMLAMQAQQELAMAAAGEKPKAQAGGKNGAQKSAYPEVPALGSRGGKQ